MLGSFAAPGAVCAGSPAAVAANADAVLVCVLDTAAVRDVVLGPGGVVEAARPGALLVDHSTATPIPTSDMAAELERRAGMPWINAPVSGGPGFARERRLTIMAGGAEAAFDRVLPIMSACAARVTRMGPVGSGQATKVINQAISGVGYVLMAEVLRPAEASGLDTARIPECLAGGHVTAPCCTVPILRCWRAIPKMLARNFDPPASLARQMLKDLDNVAKEAVRLNLDLPLVKTARKRFARYVESGGSGVETASIYNAYRPWVAGRGYR